MTYWIPALVDNDYPCTFKILQSLPVDVFLGAHGNYYGMEAKYARMASQPFETAPQPLLEMGPAQRL